MLLQLVGNQRVRNTWPFAFQYVSFCMLKHGLLEAETWPFATHGNSLGCLIHLQEAFTSLFFVTMQSYSATPVTYVTIGSKSLPLLLKMPVNADDCPKKSIYLYPGDKCGGSANEQDFESSQRQ